MSRLSSSPVQAIEAETGKRITIDSECTETTLHKCHQQEQSLLFALPRETRDLIWEYALHEELQPDIEFAENPDLCGSQLRSHTCLLLTCRRIWLETNAISFPTGVHKTWYTGQKKYKQDLIEKLTILNSSRISLLHVILEAGWISFTKDYTREELPMWPSKMIITILSLPWPDIPGTRELGTHIDIHVRDILLDDSVRNTQEVEFHLEERVEQAKSGVVRPQPGISRLHYIQQRNLNEPSSQPMDDVAKYWELEPVSKAPCRFWTRRASESRHERPKDVNPDVKYLTYKFTWRRIADFPDDYCSTADAGHTARGKAPPFSDVKLSDGLEHVSRPTTPIESKEEIRRRWEMRWEIERSLLKFAP